MKARNPVKALIVVDMQNGVYAYEDNEVFGGPALITTINRLIAVGARRWISCRVRAARGRVAPRRLT